MIVSIAGYTPVIVGSIMSHYIYIYIYILCMCIKLYICFFGYYRGYTGYNMLNMARDRIILSGKTTPFHETETCGHLGMIPQILTIIPVRSL